MNNLPPSLQLIFVVVLIARMLHLIRIHRRARLGKVDRSQEGREGPRSRPWSWSRPAEDLGLELRESPECSVLILPAQRTEAEVIGALLGYMASLGALLLLFKFPAETELLTISLIILGLLVWIGWTFLHSGSPLMRIELTPNELAFVIRYGIFFLRPIRYSRRGAHRLRFRQQLQGFLGMETSQKIPIIFFFAGKPRQKERRFIASCSPDAASWIVGGLEAWRDADETIE